MKRIKLGCLIFCFAVISTNLHSQTYEAKWESLDKRPVPKWFTDSKFGIFIHWGVYSVPAWAPANANIGVYAKYAEWYWNRLVNDDGTAHGYFENFHQKTYGKDFKYQDFAPQFKAELFDPELWASIFEKSGAKYIVLTSKHHEGFTLWPSAQSWNWNSVDIGPHRDLCGDLTKAVKSKGIHMGFYYSLYEWYNPLYKSDLSKYVDDHMIPQMKDLVTRYKPDLLWTDGEWDYKSDLWKSESFLAWLFNESPVKETIAVNDRWGSETRSKHGGFYTTEYDLVGDKEGIGDAAIHPWEECRGIGTSFGYNRIEDLSNYNTSKQLIDVLISKVSDGGNLLLDIGPTADGRIPVIMQQRLIDIGNWLKINGEAIYETTVWNDKPQSVKNQTEFFTKKGNSIYLICTQWPTKPLKIKMMSKVKQVSLLGSPCKVQYQNSGTELSITPPYITPATVPCEHAWVFKIDL